MKMKLFAGMALAGALMFGTAVQAQQQEKTAKVSGTLSSVSGEHLMVKTDDGKDAMVMLDPKTTITKGKKKVDAKALKTGDHLVAEGSGDANMLMARTVDVGAAAKSDKK
jgi:hypothetical protein